MDLTDVHTFCSGRTQDFLRGFIASFSINDEEVRNSCYRLIQTLKLDAEAHIENRNLEKAEKCYTLSLNALEIVTKDNQRLAVLSGRDRAILWCNRSFVRCKQGKLHDALMDAEISIKIDPSYTKGYWRASQAQKALSKFAEAAYCLIRALSADACNGDDMVCFISELAILVSQIKSEDEWRKYEKLNIFLPTSLSIWTQIVKNLSEHNEYEALSILTTGVCDTCQIPQTVIHKSANISGLSFKFLNVGKMLKFLADKEGTKSWHLRLAEFVVKREANICTVADSFNQPFLVAMTALSVEGELPNFLSLAWEKIPPENYDQKDSQGNSPFHILTKNAKYSKRTSEIICRDLLALGCLPTELDAEGRLPHLYVPPHHIIHRLLKSAMETPGQGIMKRLEQIRKDGNSAYGNSEYDRAVELYRKALAITLKFPAMKKEAAVLYSNIAAVYLEKEVYTEALVFAENSLQEDPDFCRGYHRKGSALAKMGQYRSACEAFLSGFHKANEDSLKRQSALRVAEIFHYIPDADTRFVKEMKKMLADSWPKIIEHLTQKSLWDQVSSLILGPPYEGTIGIMGKFSASKAVLSTIFEAVQTKRIDAPALVVQLLSQGASPLSFASSKAETHFHAAVRFCLCTNDIRVLKFMLENDREMTVQSSKDHEDRTPLHTLCIENERRKADNKTSVSINIAQLLAEKKVNVNAKDKYLRKALDYVVTDSQLKKYMIIISVKYSNTGGQASSSGTDNYNSWTALKEQGNKAYNSKDYEQAKELYSQAIIQLEKQSLFGGGMLSDENGRNLAVLYGNRAECWHKQGDIQMFLEDAKKSVDADGSWYKGHWRVGRAFREQGKGKDAVKAFFCAIMSLPESDGEEVARGILSDLIEAVYELKDDLASNMSKLRGVSSGLWPGLAFDYIKNEKWNLAEFVFTNCMGPPVKCYNVDLSYFCKKNLLDNQRWVCGLLLWFLSSGADHRKLKFHDGDTYFHATITIILLSGSYPAIGSKFGDSQATHLLNYITEQIVIPNNERNIRDHKGNTVLHLLATLQGSDKMREFLASYLLEQGVDVMAENLDRKQAIELTSSFDVIRYKLQEFMDKHKLINKWKDQSKQPKSDLQNFQQARKQENPFARSDLRNSQQDTKKQKDSLARSGLQNSQQDQDTKKQKDSLARSGLQNSQQDQDTKKQKDSLARSGLQNSQQDAKKQEDSSARSGLQNSRQDTKKQEDSSARSGLQNSQQDTKKQENWSLSSQTCEKCKRRLQKSSQLKKENYQQVYSDLVDVICCKGNSSAHHRELTDRAIQQIASLLSNDVAQEIPHSVFKISAKRFKDVLTILANSGKWLQVEMLVTKFKQKKGQYSLPDFAKKMSLLDLISDQSLKNMETIRINLINLLVIHGASTDNSVLISALKMAVKHSEWQVAMKLLELKADPKSITLSPGDTPYHAALEVALNKQPGNFSLLEKLKYIEDNEKLTDLDVSCQDANGNTLLHIAAQAKFNQHSLKAVELLCQWNVPADKQNKEGKLAIHYLPSEKDRRAQYLKRSFGGGTVAGISRDDIKSAHESTSASTSREPGSAKLKGSQQESIGTSLSSTQALKENIEKILLAFPEVNYNFLMSEEKGAQDDDEELEEESENDESESEQTNNEAEDIDEPLTDMTGEHEAEPDTEGFNIDVKAFDTLEWDIECTEDVWSTLKSKKEKDQVKGSKGEENVQKKQRREKMPYNLKQMIVKKIYQVASGDWTPHLQRSVADTPDSLQLFRIVLPEGVSILWELAVAFSPRLYDSSENILAEELEQTSRHSAIRGNRVYSEVIRVWSIVLKHSDLRHVVQKVIDSHQRGKSCIIQKKLRLLNSAQFDNPSSTKHLPVLYVEQDVDPVLTEEMQQGFQRMLFPPASNHKNEFHVLKFYSFSSSLVSAVLSEIDAIVDFPFRVTDTEHSVINLESKTPLLLLGRSGTGKTTCCLYRMWSMFLHYWEQAIQCDAPLLPRRNFLPEMHEIDEKQQEDDVGEVEEAKSKAAMKTPRANDTHVTSQGPDFKDNLEDDSHQEGSESENENDESFDDSAVQYDHLHQLFVTKNPVLCSEVNKNFLRLCRAATILCQHCSNKRKNLPNTLQDVDEFSFPLFLTSRQLLLMLDASADGDPFFPRDEDLALKVEIPGWGTQEDIFSIIPLEQDIDDNVDGENATSTSRMKHSGARHDFKKYSRQECTYEVFADVVWPKVSKKAEVDCHPSLVWTEIMSFIKGSFESLHTEKGFLSEAQYIELGHKRAPNFSGNRSQVYDVFLRYQHYKQQHSLFDEADLVYKIYCRLRAMTFQPWILHEIYVDETQDFTQAELALLVLLCSDPNKMFLTGDTAQSIMRGISFRFNDLRALFFYAKESAKKNERHLSEIKVPQKVHQLTHNYRSHTGILSLASSVLDILLELFPDSFDPLEKDQGMFAGPKPILIESSSPGDLALLLSGSKRKTSHIEFGAHQAVLVASDTAKDKLPEELGTGIVLTIFESKGLEFDDVLIYNFFKDSQAKKEWRVVSDFLRKIAQTETKRCNLDSLVEIDIDALAQSHKTRPLQFDPNLHKVLNSELKHLYTAITRARVNVWIFDEDDEKRAPMFEYFKARELVKCMGTEECENVNEAIMFADRSSAEEWKLAGDKYMNQKLYTVAAKCYRLAEQPDREKLALAYQTALEASRMRHTPRAMRDAYFKAGTQFVNCGDLLRASACFQNAREFLLAALAFEKNGQFEDASVQYIRAQKVNDASRCLEQVGMFGRAIRVLVENELFDRAIDCHRRYEMEVEKFKRDKKPVPAILIENKPSDVHSEAALCYRSANFHNSRGDASRAIAAIKRSKNPDDQVLFLQEKGFLEEAAVILRQEGKTEQAAHLMLRSGNTDKALEYSSEGLHKPLIAFIHLVLARKYESGEEYNLEMIKYNAMKALNMYSEMEDNNGLAQAKLILGKHTVNKKQINEAYRDFKRVKPPNLPGQLDCFTVQLTVKQNLNSVDDCNIVLRHIEVGFQILDVLLNPKTDSIDKYQLYMSFYGMELDTVKDQVTWYPHHFPRCRDFIETENGHTKSVTLGKDKAVNALKTYLLEKIEKWAKSVKQWVEEQKPSHLHCISYLEGHLCSTDCKNLHKPYETSQDEANALDLLTCSVAFDYIVWVGKEKIAKNPKKDDSEWNSVKELLHFVFPTYSLALRGQEHVQEIIGRLRNSKNAVNQVQRYFRYLWDNPGRVGKGKSKDIIKERCKSTNWIVQACFFASLLKFTTRLDVATEVSKLEEELMTGKRKWVWKKKKYALFSENKQGSLLVESIGTRFIQSFHKLIKPEPDPFEALFPITKMISALGWRGQQSLMPSLDHLVFWTEFYFCLTIFFIAKANLAAKSTASFYMTKSFFANLQLITACTESPAGSPPSIQQLVVAQHKNMSAKVILQRQCHITNFLVGHNEYSNFSLINQAKELCEKEKPDFLLAERIIILSALILLNIPQSYVDANYEVPIRREIFKLQVTNTMPERLASIINDLKKASNYRHVAESLLNCFSRQGCDGLLSCQWLGQKFHPLQFNVASLSECPVMNFFDKDIQAEAERTKQTPEDPTSDDTKLENAQMGEELDEEDRRRIEAKMAEIEEEKEKKMAVKIIVNFLKVKVMERRLQEKAYLYFELEETLKPFSVSDSYCGICGTKLALTETAGSEDGKTSQETSFAHYQGSTHLKNFQDFKTFKEQFSQIHPKHQEIKHFISAYGVVENSQVYKDIELETSKLLKDLQGFENALRSFLTSRKWSNGQELFKVFSTLKEKFDKDHKTIETIYEENKNQDTRASYEHKATVNENTEQTADAVVDVTEIKEDYGSKTDENQYFENRGGYRRKNKQQYQQGNRRGNQYHRNGSRQHYGNRNREEFNKNLPPRFMRAQNAQQ